MSELTIAALNNLYSSTNTNASTKTNDTNQVAFGSILSQKTGSSSTLQSIFDKAAKKYGVDVNLLTAVAKHESNFTSDIVSSAGAIGMMQLMPYTAKYLGVSNPYDAEQNIMGGAKLLAEYLDKYNGNVSLALAAYSAGSGAVDKYNGVPPYAETQAYVKNITSTYKNGTEVPDYPRTADNPYSTVPSSSSTTRTTSLASMTPEERAAAARNAKLDKELEQIPDNDIALYSNTDTTIASTDTTSTATAAGSTSNSTSSDASGYSYEDYLSFVDDYINIVSGLTNAGDDDSDNDSISSTLNNYLSSSQSTTNYNSSVLSLLQSALAAQKDK